MAAYEGKIKMNDEEEKTYVCLYCGDAMFNLSARQLEIFGQPECCETNMSLIEYGKIYTVINALEKLKNNLEQETIKDL